MARIKNWDVFIEALPLWMSDEPSALSAVPSMRPRELAEAYERLAEERFRDSRARRVECLLAAGCLWPPSRIALASAVQALGLAVREGSAESPTFSMREVLEAVLRRDDPSSLGAALAVARAVAMERGSEHGPDFDSEFGDLYTRLAADAIRKRDAPALTMAGDGLFLLDNARAVNCHVATLRLGTRGVDEAAWRNAIFSLAWFHGERVPSGIIDELRKREARGRFPIDGKLVGKLFTQDDRIDDLLQAPCPVTAGEVRELFSAVSQPSVSFPVDSESAIGGITTTLEPVWVSDSTSMVRVDGPADVLKLQAREIDAVLADLDGLVGLSSVKTRVRELVAMHRMNRQRVEQGLPAVDQSLHLVFAGPPGTGKTTVARLLAEAYSAIGILRAGKFREVGRVDLVDGYLGQTALKTQAVIDSVMGGVLFIDEAYSLAGESSDAYGDEALATLLKAMEDRRGQFAVIAAGYTDEMGRLIASNPGLRSRFPTVIEFEPYSDAELLEIFGALASTHQFGWEQGVPETLLELFRTERERVELGNGRYVRNVFETMARNVAVRAMESGANGDFETFCVADVPNPTA